MSENSMLSYYRMSEDEKKTELAKHTIKLLRHDATDPEKAISEALFNYTDYEDVCYEYTHRGIEDYFTHTEVIIDETLYIIIYCLEENPFGSFFYSTNFSSSSDEEEEVAVIKLGDVHDGDTSYY
eukprot:TRINITY_DN11292_c0_g1_i1.p1 TRINITY_DN11292_c0_g1~~TRINITY_DN11292_c0_g1_i1.p1  ORF type:complete len:139 (+),score=38.59 TRINITY_DN11292_c0_g1_i1:45-419(+)